MIIDCTAHLGHWPFRKLAHSDAEGFLGLMDVYGIAQAWVGAFEGLFYRDMGRANRDLVAGLAGHEDRLLPWATINPNFARWERDLTEAQELGCVGVRLYPNYHAYTLTDTCLRELLAALREAWLPVAIFQKFVDMRVHHWHCLVPDVDMDLTPLVAEFPDLPIIWVGGGWQQAAAVAEVIRQGQVHCDISRVEGLAGVARLSETIGADRVLFGSHAPYFVLEAAVLKIQEAGLSEADRAAVLYGNATHLLGG
jgi:uncharacterized protein